MGCLGALEQTLSEYDQGIAKDCVNANHRRSVLLEGPDQVIMGRPAVQFLLLGFEDF
jgi:hypothetical protein